MTITVKSAVDAARGFLADVLKVPVSQLLLEEVELTDDNHFWLVTFSYPAPEGSSFQTILGGGRLYKIVKVKADTGDFVSVKIRTLAAA